LPQKNEASGCHEIFIILCLSSSVKGISMTCFARGLMIFPMLTQKETDLKLSHEHLLRKGIKLLFPWLASYLVYEANHYLKPEQFVQNSE
jgi:hypothetical protein